MEASAELREVTRRFIRAFGAGDFTVARNLLLACDDLTGVGSDPEEWYRGADAIPILERQLAEMAGIVVEIDEIDAWSHGEAGWSLSRVRCTMATGYRLEMRWTMVFVSTMACGESSTPTTRQAARTRSCSACD